MRTLAVFKAKERAIDTSEIDALNNAVGDETLTLDEIRELVPSLQRATDGEIHQLALDAGLMVVPMEG